MNPNDSEWLSWVQAPIQVDDADAAEWDDHADVVIVGFGGAGVCAALQAKEAGVDVLAIDRFEGGGATALSGGIVYAGGTRYQKQAGYDDSADAMFRYLKMEGTLLSDATLREYCDASPASLDWLSGYGLSFDGTLDPGKTTYPLPGTSLYFSGNERVEPYASAVPAAPRGHRTAPRNGEVFTGSVFFATLRDAALQAGVRTLYHAPVQRLIVDRSGAVVGVEVNRLDETSGEAAQHRALHQKFKPMVPFGQARAEKALQAVRSYEAVSGRPVRIHAKGGVILAAGGLVHNQKMMDVYAPQFEGTLPQGTLADDGSGIRLGQSVGGGADRLGRMNLTKSIIPPVAYAGGMVVNTAGERFVNEEIYSGALGAAVTAQPSGKAWLIIDSAQRSKGLRESLPRKGSYPFTFFGLPVLANLFFGTKSARSFEALAAKCGIDPAGLVASKDRYNAAIALGVPDEFGKRPSSLHELSGKRYYAVNLSLKNQLSPSPVFSLGGLTVEENDGAVTREDGSRVEGLYAVGRNAIGLPSETYVSGLAIADCIFSGRRAGRAAAQKVRAYASVHVKEGLVG